MLYKNINHVSSIQLSTYIHSVFYADAGFHLYFIMTVIQFYVIFPAISRIKKGGLTISIALFSLLLNYLWIRYGDVNTRFNLVNDFLNSRGFLLNWIFYFVFGVLYAVYYKELRSLLIKYKKTLIFVSCILIIKMFYDINLSQLITSITNYNLIYAPVCFLLVVYIFEEIKNFKYMYFFDTIGRFSMGIYLVHPLIIKIVGYINLWLEINFLLFTFILTISLSLFIVYLISLIPFGNYIVPIAIKERKPKKKEDEYAV